jgi:hypothetical protein
VHLFGNPPIGASTVLGCSCIIINRYVAAPKMSTTEHPIWCLFLIVISALKTGLFLNKEEEEDGEEEMEGDLVDDQQVDDGANDLKQRR